MDGVLLDGCGIVRPDGPGPCLLRIRVADKLAVANDCVVALEDHEHYGPRDHVVDQFHEKRLLAVLLIEAHCLLRAQVDHLGADNREPGVLKAVDDIADEVSADHIGLNNGKCSLYCHFHFSMKRR